MSTGDTIGADILAVEEFLEPILSQVPSPVTAGILTGLKLLAAAEPAAYKAIVAVVQGTPLTPEQEQERDAADQRLINPEAYFS